MAVKRLTTLRSLILGPPGCGKGTISTRIVKDFPLKHISSGDILRSHIVNETEMGLRVKPYLKRGDLVPDSLMIEIISAEIKDGSGAGWLLDGFPRTISQAEALESVQKDLVFNLNVPFEVIVERIQGRSVHVASGRVYHDEFNPPKQKGLDDVTNEPLTIREDDRPETVQKRLLAYQTMTEPVLEYYAKKGILVEFSGKYSNEIWPKVHEYISTKIDALQYTVYK